MIPADDVQVCPLLPKKEEDMTEDDKYLRCIISFYTSIMEWEDKPDIIPE